MYFLERLRPLVLACLTAALLAGCGGGGGGSSETAVVATAQTENILTVTVDSGPTGAAYLANRLFATVTICHPTTSVCKTLDHVLVDTGSTGLRVLASELGTGINLPAVTGDTGFTLLNCARFLDGSFMWGPVATAHVQLGGKTALNIPVQVVADASSSSSASTCATSGTQITSAIGSGASALGAKGILGIGNYKEDCGNFCVSSTLPARQGYYFACTDSSCSAAAVSTASIAKQVKNPVPLFSSDNNGLVVVLPAVSGSSTSTLTGSIVFGIGTRDNNQPGNATLLQLLGGNISTSVNSGATLTDSFLDTGSNGLFFDTALTQCSFAVGFYCPTSTTSFSAVLTGSNGLPKTVNFNVSNAESLFQFGLHVFPGLAGPLGDSNAFDWGLPFFFGRSVFIGIEGSSSSLGSGTYYAF